MSWRHVALTVSLCFGVTPALATEEPASASSGTQGAPTQSGTGASSEEVPPSLREVLPKEIHDYPEGKPPPPGYARAERPRTGLAVAGGITLGVSYGLSAAIPLIAILLSAGSGDRYQTPSGKDGLLFVPLAGPFLYYGGIESRERKGSAGILFLGAGQCVGLGLIGLAELFKKDVVVRTASIRWQGAPVVTRGANGVAIVGSF